MPLMSSKMTFFYKRVFPVIWFSFLAAFFVIGLVNGFAADPLSNLPLLIVPVVMGVIGYQFMKKMAFNLVDQVFDLGDALLVRNGGQEERIALADIKNVSFVLYMSPVTLSLPAVGRVRRLDRVLGASADHAAIAESDARKIDRPHRRRAPARLRA